MAAQEELIIHTFLGNPYAAPPADLLRARQALSELDFAAAVDKRMKRGNHSAAKELILAVGHARAIVADNPASVLDDLPSSKISKLPRPKSSYLRIAAAAGRCSATLDRIFGDSEAIRKVRRDTWAACFGSSLLEALELERVIRDHDVLILGETGTGKESFARAVQAATPGADDGSPAPSAAINAAAIPESLVESELFGHIKGSFTGATDTRTGRIRSASGGSFFLDEVGDLPRTTQVKLLRVIETNEVYPVGSDKAHQVDVRYVAATHKDLQSMASENEFRRDLYERIAGNIIRIPPLRDRPEDIVAIGRAFVEFYLQNPSQGQHRQRIDSWLSSGEARSYAWPGNVRELQNALRNLMLGLAPELGSKERESTAPSEIPGPIENGQAPLETVTDWYIERVLDISGKNYSQAARILGLDRSTVKRRTSSKKKS